MMAKRKEDRYENVEELLQDLEAIRNGQPPYRAHKRFDMTMLEQLEEGDTFENEQVAVDEEVLAKYRIAVVILGAGLALSILVILLLLVV
jgi:hypothetical protein